MDVSGIGSTSGATSVTNKPQAVQAEDQKKIEQLQAQNSEERRQDQENVEAKVSSSNPKTRGGNIDTYA